MSSEIKQPKVIKNKQDSSIALHTECESSLRRSGVVRFNKDHTILPATRVSSKISENLKIYFKKFPAKNFGKFFVASLWDFLKEINVQERIIRVLYSNY